MRTARLVAAAALAGAVLTGLPAAPAAAVPSHVAITVAGDRSACVSWHSGMTGTDVLVAAGYQLTWGQRPPYQGMLLQIDGAPGSPNPQQAYWAYFENGSYSPTGPASSTPAAGSVEGWRYVPADGSTPPGPGGSYASICAGKDTAPSTKPAPKPPAHTATAPAERHTSTLPRQGTTAPRPAVRSSVPHRSATAPPSTASAAVSAAAVGAASTPTPDPRSASPVAHSRTTSGGQPPWGTLIGVAALLALGGGGFWFSRRRAGP